MKKITLFLALILAVGCLCSCGKNADKTSSSSKDINDYDNIIELPEDKFD